jgi:lysophospholipase L1-like esterase
MATNNSSLTDKIRVACVGDSITELTDYPNHLQQLLGKNYIVGNFGACGSTVSLDSESPYLYSQAFKNAIEFLPNMAVILLGTNDADPNLEQYRGNFVEDYLSLIERFLSLASKPRVWVVKPPPIFKDWMGLSPKILSQEIVPAVAEVEKRSNLSLIDVYSALQNPRYFADGVHPNEEGAELIAKVIYHAVFG